MEVVVGANICDNQTSRIADALGPVFILLNKRLSGDYGGIIEHLWIHFELLESQGNADGTPSFPFRFQKRVSGRSTLGLPRFPDEYNVGHFSVRPNFRILMSLPNDKVVPYALGLIYKELLVLHKKEKKLGGFNTELFRNRFYIECQSLGYKLDY